MLPKRKRGRPILPREQRRSLSVHATVTPDEYRRIKRAAHEADLSVSAWVRQWVLDGLRKSPR